MKKFLITKLNYRYFQIKKFSKSKFIIQLFKVWNPNMLIKIMIIILIIKPIFRKPLQKLLLKLLYKIFYKLINTQSVQMEITLISKLSFFKQQPKFKIKIKLNITKIKIINIYTDKMKINLISMLSFIKLFLTLEVGEVDLFMNKQQKLQQLQIKIKVKMGNIKYPKGGI